MSEAGANAEFVQSRLGVITPRRIAFLFLLCLAAGQLVSSAGLFTVDEYFYVRAAEAMAEEGMLSFRQFDVHGAPALDMNFARPGAEAGLLAPQYPSGYAILAAPFFLLFGIKGLMLLNAFCGGISLWLTIRIARKAGADEVAAFWSAGLLVLGTYWSSYVYAIWPHMVSLAVMLGVADRAIAAAKGDMRAALVAGLIAGVGQNVRIDMVAIVPVIVVWLRAFGVHQNRLAAIIFLAGFAPGLLLATSLNFLKFGVFNPFTYANAVASNDPSKFLLLGILSVAGIAAVLAIDPKKAGAAIVARPRLSAALLLAPLFSPQFRALLHGYWYELVDSQSYAHLGRQVGIDRNEWGWLVFYGLSKKALVESVPFAVLAIFPIVKVFSGKAHAIETLLLMIGAAIATLYSLNMTDSGLGLNARFLIPLLPLISIIAVIEFKSQLEQSSLGRLDVVKWMSVGFAAFFALRTARISSDKLATPLDLYPQLAIAALLFLLIAAFIWRPEKKTAATVVVWSAVAFGSAAAINLSDFIFDQSYRRHVAEQSELYEGSVPRDALLFTSWPTLFAKAATEGLAVAYPAISDPEREVAAISAYRAAGRCVFAQGDAAIAHLKGMGLPLEKVGLGPEFMLGGIAILRDPGARCGLIRGVQA